MAMIKCPECSTNVSDKATVCANCGYPIAEYVREKNNHAQELYDSIKNQNLGMEQIQQEIESKLSAGEFWDVKIYIDFLREKYGANDYVKMYDAAIALNISTDETIDILKKNINLYKRVPEGEALCIKEDIKLLAPVIKKVSHSYYYSSKYGIDEEINSRFYYPTYIARENTAKLIQNSISDEEKYGKGGKNGFKLYLSNYSNTELQVRNSLNGFLDYFNSVENGYKIISAWKLGENLRTNKKCVGTFSLGKLEYNSYEMVDKIGIDVAEIDKNLIGLAASVLTLEPNSPKKPMSTAAGTFMGGLIAGPVGAMVGFAASADRNNRYSESVENSARIREEHRTRREESTEKFSSLPTKTKRTKRHKFSYYYSREFNIKEEFYVDETDENFVFEYDGNTYTNVSDFIEIIQSKTAPERSVIEKQIRLKREKGIYVPDGYASYKFIDKINFDQSTEEIIAFIDKSLMELVNSTNDICLIYDAYDEYDKSISQYLNVDVQKNIIIDKYNESVENRIKSLNFIDRCDELILMIACLDLSKTDEYKQQINKKCDEIVAREILKLKTRSDAQKLIDTIKKCLGISNKNEYIKKVEREFNNCDLQEKISKLEEEIKSKEAYLAQLHQMGHRCPAVLVLLGIVAVISLGFIGYDGGVTFGIVVVALIIVGITGRPSTRPAIPKTKNEIRVVSETIE